MTNQVAGAACGSAGVTDRIMQEFGAQFGQGQDLWNQILAWLSEKGVSFAINLLVAVLILIVGAFAIKLIRAAVAKALSKVKRMSKLLSDFLVSVVSKTCWAVLLLVVLQRLGVDVGPLVAGLGVTGFIIGFACQETLGSFAAGIMIALNQPFKVGDYVVAGGVEGAVLELNMMATVFATADNKQVVVPNKVVWGGAITNFSALGKRRVDTKVSVAYGTDLKRAVSIALAAIKDLPGVLTDPAPAVAVASLDESAVTINVRPWASCADYWAVWSSAQEAVKKAFEAEGIEIPFQQLAVHMVDAKA
jgi:small conductance mechanosensitive channel